MKFVGTRPTYQIFAIATFLTGCVYYLFNKFYIGKRPFDDSNDICKKRPPTLDIEDCEVTKKENDKSSAPLDVVSRIENDKLKGPIIESGPKNNQSMKGVTDIDGGSDSGVDNPAYAESEVPSDVTRKDDCKITK